MTKNEAQERCSVKWEIIGTLKPGGQGIVFKVRHRESGEQGVLKFLQTENAKSLRRFEREIKFLADPSTNHENIIRILDYSFAEDNLWYIVELGEPFYDYWKELRITYNEKPNELLEKAVAIVKGLLSGLSLLHSQENPIVHRDIKPKNIVMVKDNPVLIDFGTVFLPAEERLTDPKDFIGNVRYSHDKMLYRMDEIVPWLDVFQISQTLIWMMQETPSRNFDRPLDYRYVRYPDGLEDRHILALRAFTGLCGEESLSPKNAGDAAILLDNLFHFKNPMHKDNSFAERVKDTLIKVNQTHSEEKSKTELARLERVQLVSTYALAFLTYYPQWENLLGQFIAELQSAGLGVSFPENYEFDPKAFVEEAKLALAESRNIQFLIRTYRINKTSNAWLIIKLDATFYWETIGRGLNPFGIVLYGAHAIPGVGTKAYSIGIQHDGQLWGGYGKVLNTESILAELREWVLDADAWTHSELF
jgi:serine/threonine protein kinase